MKHLKKNFLFLFLILIIFSFFTPFFLKGKLPIPSDTIVGLYHPYRDFYSQQYPRGIPFKNFLITDPVRQLYIWKELSVSQLFRGEAPVWNPYEMTGKPLLANIQSGPFYPLNLIFVIKPFYLSWSLFIFSSMLLSGVFMYLYLVRNKLSGVSSFVGAASFVFSGFITSWLEWGNVVHTILWLPLVLLSIDKISDEKLNKKKIAWSSLLIFSFTASFLAGHLQTFFYVIVFSVFYFLFFHLFSKKKSTIPIILSFFVFILLILPYSLKIFEFISLSARSIDQSEWTKVGWFIPWKHLVQFFSPDFFGNPTTLNYWGEWNYAEFVGFIGVAPLFLALLAATYLKEKRNLFFLISVVISLLLALPNFISYIPFIFRLPIISTSQPTRILAITCFSLSVLSAIGIEKLQQNKQGIKKRALGIFLSMTVVYVSIWLFALRVLGNITIDNASVAKRNLLFPTLIFFLASFFFIIYLHIKKPLIKKIVITLLLVISVVDGFRFAAKFNPFTEKSYLFPVTPAIEFLKNDLGVYRIASTDSRIFPPNFPTVYRISTIEGYDPLYLKSYAEYITLNENNNWDLKNIQSFNRIVTPRNLDTQLIDFLNVKYVLSLTDINNPKYEKVFQEGETRVYKNNNAFNRAFFTNEVMFRNSEVEILKSMRVIDLSKTAIVLGEGGDKQVGQGQVIMEKYSENKVNIETQNSNEGFLVLSDAYYPGWKATVDGAETKIYKTNVAFRGIFVPAGHHVVKFYMSAL